MPRRPLALLCLLALAACGDEATHTVAEGQGPSPKLPPPRPEPDPYRQHRPRPRLGRGRHAEAGRRAARRRLRRGAGPSALAHRAAERRRAGGRDQRARRGRRTARGSRAGSSSASKQGRAGASAQRQPHHAAARRRRRRRRGDAHGVARGLNSPFGMALVGDDLYVANTDALLRFPYTPGETRITAPGDEGRPTCPAGRSTITGPRTSSPVRDGSKLYVAVGSNSNVAENGMEAEEGRAAIWEVDRADRQPPRLRLRPAQPGRPGLGAEDRRAVDRGERARRARQRPRARLHDRGRDGGFYGWPYSYYGQHVDTRVQPQRPGSGRARPSRPTTRSARTPPRSAWPSHGEARAAGALSRTACSSASTAPGTASRAAATR